MEEISNTTIMKAILDIKDNMDRNFLLVREDIAGIHRTLERHEKHFEKIEKHLEMHDKKFEEIDKKLDKNEEDHKIIKKDIHLLHGRANCLKTRIEEVGSNVESVQFKQS